MSSVAGDLGELIQEGLKPMLQTLSEGGPGIVTDLKAFTGKLNETMAQIDVFLSEENVQRIESILVNLESTSGSFAAVSGELEQTRIRVDELLELVNVVVEENRRPVGDAVADLQESLESVSRHIEAVAHHLEVTTRNMNEFSRQIRENPGVIIRGRSSDDGGS
jgi:phospholipid/cholesterol/gamma-HCH transport system substrate-binding protein